jgi:hypothetical protein
MLDCKTVPHGARQSSGTLVTSGDFRPSAMFYSDRVVASPREDTSWNNLDPNEVGWLIVAREDLSSQSLPFPVQVVAEDGSLILLVPKR